MNLLNFIDDNNKAEEKKEKIKELAIEFGFDDIGFASYQLMEVESNHYNNWIEQGYNASMQWMNNYKEQRRDVRILFENTNSVIVLLHNYKNEKQTEQEYKISKYAWGDDYHNVLKSKLKRFTAAITQIYPDFQFRHFTDTAPILEKQWAVKAGLGWQGKNGLFISRKLGSFVFISVILNNFSFESPKIVTDHCGKCTKCLDACPTQAIISPQIVDANRCISHWTIETRDATPFPPEVRKNLKNWVFGCDICQDVCPWNNERVKLTTEPRYYPRDKKNILPEEIDNLTEDEFVIKFNNSPVRRARLVGLLRNINEIKLGGETRSLKQK